MMMSFSMMTADFWIWLAVVTIALSVGIGVMLRAYLGSGGLTPLFKEPIALSSDLDDAEAQVAFSKGEEAFRAGRYRWAADKFSQAIQLSPGLAEAYHNRGLLAANMRQTTEAASDLAQAGEFYFQQEKKAALSQVREDLETVKAGKPVRKR
jgi:tetratricopeptide (TPR) repeat protein